MELLLTINPGGIPRLDLARIDASVLLFAVTRWMEEMLFGISATDPMAYALIAALMILVAVVAAFGRARRATRVDPVEVLRG